MMPPDELAVNTSFSAHPGEDLDSLSVGVEIILESIKPKYLGRPITAELRSEIREEIGNRIRNLPGIADVRVTIPVSGNPPKVQVQWQVDLNTGAISQTHTEVIEGDPVRRPPWASNPGDD